MKQLVALILALPVLAQAPNQDWYRRKAELHFVPGFCISLTFGEATRRPLVGFGVGLLAGIGKEVWDNNHGDESKMSQRRDILITAAGAAAAAWVIQARWGKHGSRRAAAYRPVEPIANFDVSWQLHAIPTIP